MNIYEMYIANRCKYGYLVIRDVGAKNLRIEGMVEGVNILGTAPCYGNPVVYAEFYEILDVLKENT